MISRKKARRVQIWVKLKPILMLVFLLILLSITFSYAMFQGGFVSWFLFYSFLPFLVYSFLLLCYPLQSFRVERSITPEECSAGDQVEVVITLYRKFPFPLFFLLIEDVTQEGLHINSKKVVFPGLKKSVKVIYQIESIPRGEHIFEAVRVKTADALGLVEKESWFDCQNTMLVYPKTTEMVYRSLESRFEQGGTASVLQFQKDTSLVAGVRQYYPGDRFSWIDWKATARTNELMSKEFEIRQSNDVLFILDATHQKNFEEAVSFVASSIKSILHHGGQVGFFSAGSDGAYIPIRDGEYHQQQILRHLAKVTVNPKTHISTIIENQTSLHYWPAVIIIVTTVLDEAFINGAAIHMRRKGMLIVYFIKKKGDATPDDEIRMKAIAANQGIYIKTLYDGEFRKAFLEVRRA